MVYVASFFPGTPEIHPQYLSTPNIYPPLSHLAGPALSLLCQLLPVLAAIAGQKGADGLPSLCIKCFCRWRTLGSGSGLPNVALKCEGPLRLYYSE